ncbi:MAG: ParB N-terminal domain-containing protein [Spirochaetota bacterium]|nr:ParB N-terminal domain-containing protein [Spirochaetota bacterium]
MIKKIDQGDDFFRLSKNSIVTLKRSIDNFGLLDPPILLRRDDRYVIVFGHNRIKVLVELDYEYIDSLVLDCIPDRLFLEYILLKSLRGEIGPIGRIKAINILKNYFGLNNEILSTVSKYLNIPDELIRRDELYENIVNLPVILQDYLDIKEIGYKAIKNIFYIPSEGISLLIDWIIVTNMRINIFKNIVDYIIDIYKRDGNLNSLRDIDVSTIQDRREKENHLFDRIFRVRYPEYSGLRERAEGIVKRFKGMGVQISYPKYFEGETIKLTFNISNREDIESIMDRFKKIDMKAIAELRELL